MALNKNLSINGLRGLASLIVIIYHVYGMAYLSGFFEERSRSGMFKVISNFGAIGVNLFFMISGYLIISSLLRHKNIKLFLIDRVIRIYPLFLLLHILLFLIGPISNYSWFSQITVASYLINFFSNVFLLPGIFDLPIAQKNAWSLSYEFTFYILAAWGFSSFFKISYSKIINLILFLSVSLSLVLIHHTMIFFVLGVIIFYVGNKFDVFYFKYRLYFLTGLPLFVWLLYVYEDSNVLSISVLVPSLFLFLNVVKQKGMLNFLLKSNVFQKLGDISYSMYLLHPFVLFGVKIIFSVIDIQMYIKNEYILIILFGLISILITVIVAMASHRLIEVSLTKKIKQKVHKKYVVNIKREKIS